MAAMLAVAAILMAAAAAEAQQSVDQVALLDFLQNVPHEARIRWNASASMCSWVGVTCSGDRSAVVALRLPGAGLVGPIPPGTLGRLSSLRVLSLRANSLSGDLPADLANLTLLRSLYLQDNTFSGGFPAVVLALRRLSRLDLSNNTLTGEIPFAVNNLTRLTGLLLQGNNFSGSLPSINVESIVAFDVSNNRLNGSIPESLSRFPASSFVGNLDLCGAPLPPCQPFFPSPSPAATPATKSSGGGLSTAKIIGISVAGAVLLLLLLLLFICCIFRRRRSKRGREKASKPPVFGAVAAPESGASTSREPGGSEPVSAEGDDRSRLVFVGQGKVVYRFDLEDLLRASAEVLGKGTVGTSYKAVLEDGTTVVVKRLKDVIASPEEFQSAAEALTAAEGHDNVLPLRAFYFSKEEKLLVYDFLPSGSLSATLHGSRSSGRTSLGWESRLQVALAAARGLEHIHARGLLHGNLKSSNVLLRRDGGAVVTDYGLSPLFFPSTATGSRATGYRAPEAVETGRASRKADVYSLGVLLLELLTGRAPNQAAVGGPGGGEDRVDLPRWVKSVVREEWTAEVFDAELMRYAGAEEEMVELLQVAMALVAVMPDSRPDASEAVAMVEAVASLSGAGGPSE